MTEAPISVHTVLPDNDQRELEIRWNESHSDRFHYVWLRHAARTPDGMSNDTSVKIDLIPDQLDSLVVLETEISENRLLVKWKDDDEFTDYSLAMLKDAVYNDESRSRRKNVPEYWDAVTSDQIPRASWADLEQDSTLQEIMAGVCRYGLVKISNVPTKPGSIAGVAERLGPIHINNYGRIFDVRTNTNVGLGSNTGAFLGPHTDESYRHAPPGISLFHCLEQCEKGGESILVDGFHAAQHLREKNPEAFEVLSGVPVFFQRLAEPEENMQAHARIISTDIDGDVQGIRFTDRTIPPQDVPAHLVEPLYRGIHAFWKIVNDPLMQYRYRMHPGDLHIFDNHRVLHGRTAFDAGESSRFLQQCSVNRDEFHNNFRLLSARLGRPGRDWTLTDGAQG